MKYQQSTFSVGGYRDEYSTRWEETFTCRCCGHHKHSGKCYHVDTEPGGAAITECECENSEIE